MYMQNHGSQNSRNSGGSSHRSVKSRTEQTRFLSLEAAEAERQLQCEYLPHDTTPFSAHCEVMSQRKRHSQQRLEAFIEKKKVQKLQGSFCKVSDAGTPTG